MSARDECFFIAMSHPSSPLTIPTPNLPPHFPPACNRTHTREMLPASWNPTRRDLCSAIRCSNEERKCTTVPSNSMWRRRIQDIT